VVVATDRPVVVVFAQSARSRSSGRARFGPITRAFVELGIGCCVYIGWNEHEHEHEKHVPEAPGAGLLVPRAT
jgi:hypothetical protein